MTKMIPIPRIASAENGCASASGSCDPEPELDIDELADYVYDLLKQDLRLNRERLGTSTSSRLT